MWCLPQFGTKYLILLWCGGFTFYFCCNFYICQTIGVFNLAEHTGNNNYKAKGKHLQLGWAVLFHIKNKNNNV